MSTTSHLRFFHFPDSTALIELTQKKTEQCFDGQRWRRCLCGTVKARSKIGRDAANVNQVPCPGGPWQVRPSRCLLQPRQPHRRRQSPGQCRPRLWRRPARTTVKNPPSRSTRMLRGKFNGKTSYQSNLTFIALILTSCANHANRLSHSILQGLGF